jgi:hypothetical protein
MEREISFISCNILPGISGRNGVLLEVECDEMFREPKVERIITFNAKQTFGLASFPSG